MKIGVIVLATGEYRHLVQPLIASASRFFLKGHGVQWFILTDNPEPLAGCVCLPTVKRGWHAAMQNRFGDMLVHSAAFSEMDFLINLDADMQFVAPVGDEILTHEMFFTESPLSKADRPNVERPWHRNPLSRAYVSLEESEGRTYITGAFHGGRRETYLRFLNECQANLDIDIASGHVNTSFNEESQAARWYLDNAEICKLLSMEYCMPKGTFWPERKLKAKLWTLDKGALEKIKDT